MIFHIIGTSFRETPIEIRERLALDKIGYLAAHKSILEIPEVIDTVLISTCNRVEVYCTCQTGADPLDKIFKRFVALFPGIAPDDVKHYRWSDEEAYKHLFKVASALDSLVIGEPQITGQLKSGFQTACDAAPTSGFMKRVFHNSFRVAKKVRMETGISKMAVSMSYVVVELAKRIFEDLQNKTMLVIGSGEMAELAVSNLINAGCQKILIANRTFDNAALLAKKYKASAISLEKLPDFLPQADLIISSTGSKDFIITKQMAQKAFIHRKAGPVFFIDIAVPRDIDPKIEELENMFVYNVDDLEKIVKENIGTREKEAEKALEIVTQEAASFARSIREASSGPVIRALRKKFEDIAEVSIKQKLDKSGDFSPEQKERVRLLVSQMIGRLLHNPIHALRGKAGEDDVDALMIASELFQLETTKPNQKHAQNLIPFPIKQRGTNGDSY